MSAELQMLRDLYRAVVNVRDSRKGMNHPLREWMRLDEGIRRAVTELDAHYRVEDDDRTPDAERPVKHDDCTCATCRKEARNARTATVPIADIPAAIADSIRNVFACLELRMFKRTLTHAVELTAEDEARVFLELGSNAAQNVVNLDQAALEQIEPLVVDRPATRRGVRR